MKARVQESYSQGDKIQVDVVLTAHHKVRSTLVFSPLIIQQ